MSDFDTFIDLSKRKKLLKAELSSIQDALDGMQDDLIEEMAESGMTKFSTSDGVTLYVHTRTAVSPKSGREEACGALKLAGHGDLVSLNYNTTSINALFAELEKTDQLTDELVESFHINKIITIRATGIKITGEYNG